MGSEGETMFVLNGSWAGMWTGLTSSACQRTSMPTDVWEHGACVNWVHGEVPWWMGGLLSQHSATIFRSKRKRGACSSGQLHA